MNEIDAPVDLADHLSILWKRGRAPDLHDFLEQAGSLTSVELATLVRIDQRHRWQTGQRVLAEEYLRNHPQVHDDPDSALDVIFNEYLIREREGEHLDPAAFAKRFPAFSSLLMRQIELHEAMMVGASMEEPNSADARDLSLPEVPGYELLEELGRGGMGVVYKARHRELKRIVAIKMLLAGTQAGPELRARFRSEAEAVARLQHPGIVQIHEVGEFEGRPFLSLEYVGGGNLKSRLSGTPLPTAESARLIETLARAVHYAHEHGVVHRDLKPANVLVGDVQAQRLADLKIADFGLAKLLSDNANSSSGVTQTASLVGTPSYMSPEQASGKHRLVGPASDVYALGAILYELLTGRPPFQGETPLETLQQVIGEDPVAPARLRAKIPIDLQTICLKCLEKDPARRYATAAVLAGDLQNFSVGLPIAARPVGSLGSAWRWSRRNPRLAGTLAGTAALLVIISVLWSLDREAALSRARQAESDAARKLYDSRVSEARARSLSRKPGQRFATLALLDEAARQAREIGLPPSHRAELRDATIAALVMPDLSPVVSRCSCGATADLDEDLTIYATCDDTGTTHVRRLNTDEELHTIPGLLSTPFLSRDGRFLGLLDTSYRLTVWRLDLSVPQSIIQLANVWCIDFHANGQRLATSQNGGAVTLFDLPSGKVIHRIPPHHLVSQEPLIALHPTEPLIAVGSYFSPTIQIRHIETGTIERSLEITGGCAHLAWHPSGKTLLASMANGPDIQVFDRITGERQQPIGPVTGGARVHFNHKGDRLAVFDWSGVTAVKLFDYSTGRCLFELPTVNLFHVLRFSRDDQRLSGFSQEGRLGLWQVADGREYRTLSRKASFKSVDLLEAAVSPDGQLLAIALLDCVTFWDLATGTEISELPLDKVQSLYFEPDGTLVTSDRTGTYRWPMHVDSTAPGRCNLGPPQPLPLPPGRFLSTSRDYKVVATRSRAVSWEEPFAGTWIHHVGQPDSFRHVEPGLDAGYVAVSPDGKLVATGEFYQGPVKVWDAETGRLVHRVCERGGPIQFSQDGCCLVVKCENSRFYSTEDWREIKTLPGRVYYSPDGTLLVSAPGDHTFRLLDAETGNELGRFEDPNQHTAESFLLSPDNTKLITLHNHSKAVHVWDLRSLRRQLAARNLDWDAPSYPSASTSVPMSLKIDLGDFSILSRQTLASNFDRSVQTGPSMAARWFFRGEFHQSAGRYCEAASDLEKAILLAPNHIDSCNSLAWLYATGPVELRNPERAVTLADRVVRLQPNPGHLNTLGVAYYRAGRFREALETLTKNLNGRTGETDGYDLYFLALCHAEMGHPESARTCFEKANAWRKQHQSRLTVEQVSELDRFHSEAESALQIPKP